MRGVAFVLLGFGWGILHDVAALRGLPRAKPPLFLLAVISHLAGAYWLLARSPRVAMARPLQRVATVISIGALAGMIYSIAGEIPFRRAWIDRGHTTALVTTGTYAYSRHPGVLWTAIWVPAAAVATGSRPLLRLWPVIIAADILHVWIQDRLVLPRVFGAEYEAYRSRVPFLLPRWRRR